MALANIDTFISFSRPLNGPQYVGRTEHQSSAVNHLSLYCGQDFVTCRKAVTRFLPLILVDLFFNGRLGGGGGGEYSGGPSTRWLCFDALEDVDGLVFRRLEGGMLIFLTRLLFQTWMILWICSGRARLSLML